MFELGKSMSKLKWITCLLISALSFSAFAGKKSTKGEMQKILSSYMKLIPYAYNGKSLEDPEFLKYMNEFEKRLKSSTHTKFLTQTNFEPNLKIIRESAIHYKESVKMKNFYFAKRGLKTIAAKCVNCHSQLPQEIFGKVNGMYIKSIEDNIKAPYDQGMMAYLLRDYKLAIKKFSTAVKEYKHDPQIQDRSIRKILKISQMQQLGKKESITLLKSVDKEVSQKIFLKENVNSWIKQLETFKKPESGISLEKMVSKTLSPIEDEVVNGDPTDNQVTLHYMQGVLSRHLAVKPDSKYAPLSLYWLGVIENSFHEDFMFSLGDMYLKRCIKNYSSSKYAKKCYKALENSYVMGFTGSSGTSIPVDVKNELKELSKLIK